MSLTSIEAVRLKSSDKSAITREIFTGDGATLHWKLNNNTVITAPAPEVRKGGVLLVEGTDYDVDYVNGFIDLDNVAVINSEYEVVYYWSIFSDDEVSYFLSESGGDVSLATARLLLAWAADAAKVAKRQTLSGGGGLGQTVIDTSVVAKELRATAQALIDTTRDIDINTPAEGIVEIPWTEAMLHRQRDQKFIREN